MAKVIEKELNIKPELIQSSGGVFEVEVDGKLIFSKKKEFRFPTSEEIIRLIQNM
ncbi:MAG: hypothetical protein Kow0042_02200 [Calditrichia bacterium]